MFVDKIWLATAMFTCAIQTSERPCLLVTHFDSAATTVSKNLYFFCIRNKENINKQINQATKTKKVTENVDK